MLSWRQVDSVVGCDWDLVLQNIFGPAQIYSLKCLHFLYSYKRKWISPDLGHIHKGGMGKIVKHQLPRFLHCCVHAVHQPPRTMSSKDLHEMSFAAQHSPWNTWKGLDLDIQDCPATYGPGESYQGIPLPFDVSNKHLALAMLLLQLQVIFHFKIGDGFIVGKGLGIAIETCREGNCWASLDFFFMEEWVWPGGIGFFPIEAQPQYSLL